MMPADTTDQAATTMETLAAFNSRHAHHAISGAGKFAAVL
jgi:hypothetical protein